MTMHEMTARASQSGRSLLMDSEGSSCRKFPVADSEWLEGSANSLHFRYHLCLPVCTSNVSSLLRVQRRLGVLVVLGLVILSFAVIAVVFLTAGGLGKLEGPVQFSNLTSRPRIYSYVGSDFPEKWDTPLLADVHMTLENTLHYALDTPTGLAEWNSTLPRGGGLLHLGAQHDQVFSVSLFHQLRCLDAVRGAIVAFRHSRGVEAPDARAQHCMNYLREMALCRADAHLESARNPYGPHISVWDTTRKCKDWTAVYEAAEDNYDQWSRQGDGQ